MIKLAGGNPSTSIAVSSPFAGFLAPGKPVEDLFQVNFSPLIGVPFVGDQSSIHI
jgi:hypothetical protein